MSGVPFYELLEYNSFRFKNDWHIAQQVYIYKEKLIVL